MGFDIDRLKQSAIAGSLEASILMETEDLDEQPASLWLNELLAAINNSDVDREVLITTIGIFLKSSSHRTAINESIERISISLRNFILDPVEFWKCTALKTCTIQAVTRMLYYKEWGDDMPFDLIDDVSEAIFQWLLALSNGEGELHGFSSVLAHSCLDFLGVLFHVDWERFTAACSSASFNLVKTILKGPTKLPAIEDFDVMLEMLGTVAIPYSTGMSRRKKLSDLHLPDHMEENADISVTLQTICLATELPEGSALAVTRICLNAALNAPLKSGLHSSNIVSRTKRTARLLPIVANLVAFSAENTNLVVHTSVLECSVSALISEVEICLRDHVDGKSYNYREKMTSIDAERTKDALLVLADCIEFSREQALDPLSKVLITQIESIPGKLKILLKNILRSKQRMTNQKIRSAKAVCAEARNAAILCCRQLISKCGTQIGPEYILKSTIPTLGSLLILGDLVKSVMNGRADTKTLNSSIEGSANHLKKALENIGRYSINAAGDILEATRLVAAAAGSKLIPHAHIIGGPLADVAELFQNDFGFLQDCFRATTEIVSALMCVQSKELFHGIGDTSWMVKIAGILCESIEWEWKGEIGFDSIHGEEDILVSVTYEAECALEVLLHFNSHVPWVGLDNNPNSPISDIAQKLVNLGLLFPERAGPGVVFEDDLSILCKGAELILAITMVPRMRSLLSSTINFLQSRIYDNSLNSDLNISNTSKNGFIDGGSIENQVIFSEACKKALSTMNMAPSSDLALHN